MVYIYNEILLSQRKLWNSAEENEISPFATTRMDLEGIMLSKVSERKDRYCILSLICGI